MEVLPCANPTQQKSSDEISNYDGQSNGLKHGEAHHSRASYLQNNDVVAQNQYTKFDVSVAKSNSDLLVNIIENENQGEEPSFVEPEWFGRDESMALWVKFKGTWQAGIKCARVDWPLSTLKAKPAHEKNKYTLIFFPRAQNYSWAEMHVVCSVHEFPSPVECTLPNVELELLKDLTVAHRFILRKLAFDIINVIDQINTEALKETVRNVMIWKEFAMKVVSCNSYSDLGKMLPKLQDMLLSSYLNLDWIQNAYPYWVQRCQNANSAESVEILKEELINSVLRKELSNPIGHKLGSEWNSWKQEFMKALSTSNSVSTKANTEPQSSNSPLTPSIQISRKRPKLEIRRAEPHNSQIETTPHQDITIKTNFFDNRDNGKRNIEVEKWGGLVVEANKLEGDKNMEMTLSGDKLAIKKPLDPANKTRQCIAFIEAKGRQCVRLANEGDVYCCVHLASRFVGNLSKGEVTPPLLDNPLCGGTTVLGTKCKHRSLPGSSFCKKHRPHQNFTDSNLKRKYEESKSDMVESSNSKQIVLFGDVENSMQQVNPLSVIEGYSFMRNNSIVEKSEKSTNENNTLMEMSQCIGSCLQDGNNPCPEFPKRHSLYCEKHLPSWLKRARNGKSRIISKEVFIDLLKECHSQEKKIYLHRACELFYRLFKSMVSLRNQVPKEIQLQWAFSEASKDLGVGEYLMKLVCSEKEKLNKLWGFDITGNDNNTQVLEDTQEKSLAIVVNNDYPKNNIRCKFCSEGFSDDQTLGTHFLEHHRKEARWLFRGYTCAICFDSFTNKKNLENHVQERHHVEFVDQCILLQCIPCKSNFGNLEELWSHVLSFHPIDFSLFTDKNNSNQTNESKNSLSIENNSEENQNCSRRFFCKVCGLKFDLLPDLGRHHQVAHMEPNILNVSHPQNKGVRYFPYRSKLSRPRFKKNLEAVSYRIRNRANEHMKKRLQASKSVKVESIVPIKACLGRLGESQCAIIAKKIFSEIQKTKTRPSNIDIVSVACSTCCKDNLQALLEARYGVIPERLYLRAAKLCGENDIKVEWHKEGFVCPKECKSTVKHHNFAPLIPISNGCMVNQFSNSLDHVSDEWEMDESHCVINFSSQKSVCKGTLLCDDISFGKESVAVVCVVDENVLDPSSIVSDGKKAECSMPWKSFTYVTKPLINHSVGRQRKSMQLGCGCSHSICSPMTCDHVYLFDNDYEDAKDVYGKPMHGRFPYDEKGHIILEEGYLVYECNYMCSCNRFCRNRVLQNGVRVKLEVFKSEEKGWAVRAGQRILRGSFVCEYIGEIIDEQEAKTRGERYGKEGGGCSYFYKVDDRLMDEDVAYVIDATKYGNVSRFVKHSFSPNLVSRQVMVDSLDWKLAHIGFYASRDIAQGEELTYDFQYLTKIISSKKWCNVING